MKKYVQQYSFGLRHCWRVLKCHSHGNGNPSEIASYGWIPACVGMDGENILLPYILMELVTAINPFFAIRIQIESEFQIISTWEILVLYWARLGVKNNTEL